MSKYLFLMPSLYALLTYFPAGLLYVTRVFQYEPPSPELLFLYVGACSCFLFSLVLLSRWYEYYLFDNQVYKLDHWSLEHARYLKFPLFLFFLIGFFGIIRYVLDFAEWAGGIDGFFLTLFSENTLAIRSIAEKTTSWGIQLTYFGWIAATFSIWLYGTRQLNIGWVLAAILVFLLNLLFVDRTRPLWIFVTTVLFFLPFRLQHLRVRQLVRNLVLGIVVFVGVFLLIGNGIGKGNVEGRFGPSWVPLSLQDATFYATSGFAYLNRMLLVETSPDYMPYRLIYPLGKLLSQLELIDPPPAQVLGFYYTPFGTNVGTFLEPFYRDGGLGGTLFGLFVYSIGFDLMGLSLLRSNTLFGIYLWANLCFTSLVACFTPKIASFPLWLFAVLFLLTSASSRFSISIRKTTDRAYLISD